MRLGVVLLVPEPVASAVDGLRRAFSDPVRERVAPHVTLVPPVNVRVDELPDALRLLREAAGEVRSLHLALGPVVAFEGDAHVVYLEVAGDERALAGLKRVRDRVFKGPFARPLDHDYVPHVTLTQGIDQERLDAILAASAGWTAEPVRFDAVVLLEERHTPAGVRWAPVADAAIGTRIVIGRGGLELELTVGRLVDPEAAQAAGLVTAEETQPVRELPDALVVAARREGRVVGLARGTTSDTDCAAAEPDEVWVEHGHEEEVRSFLMTTWRDAAVGRRRIR